MAGKRKKVEFFTVNIMTLDSKPSELNFEDIISAKEIINKELAFKGKDLELKILSNKPDYLIGIIETTRKNNIPPKKNKKAKTVEKLGLNVDEGLAYGNIFLFEKTNRVLFYEVNKFGCYLDHFISFIYLLYKETELFKKFKIKLDVLLTKDEYNRILNMDFHKSVELQIANPTKMVKNFEHKNGPLYKVCSSAEELHSSKVMAKFEVKAKRNSGGGLASKTIREVLDDVSQVLQSSLGNDIEKVIVTGYEKDIRKLQKIDLIADRYIKEISLDEPRENSNLLEKQRSEEILKLYENCKPDFDEIFG
jgi:hypothetical protein